MQAGQVAQVVQAGPSTPTITTQPTRDKTRPIQPTATVTPTPTPAYNPSQLASGSMLVIKAQLSGDSQNGSRLSEPRAITVAADGTIWIGNMDWQGSWLQQYSHEGALLSTHSLDNLGKLDQYINKEVRYIGDIKAQGNDLWVLDNDHRIKAGIYHLSPQAKPIADYALPQDLLNGLAGIAVTPHGTVGVGAEVVAVGSGGAIISGTYQAQLTRLVDASGSYSPTAVSGLTLAGRSYSVSLADLPENLPKLGVVTVGKVRIPFTAHKGSLEDAHILTVSPDGSFYLLVGERLQTPHVIEHTLYHYTAGGKLLSRALLPLNAPYSTIAHRIAIGPDDGVYVMLLQNGWVEVVRVPLVGVGDPLPPVPFITDPIPAPPPPTPISDLALIAKEADAIVEVSYLEGNGATGWTFRHYKVHRWFKKPADWPRQSDYVDTNFIGLNTQHAYEPTGVNGDGIMFLQRCPPGSQFHMDEDAFCHVTGGVSGIFLFDGGEVAGAGITRYYGWSVNQFETELRSLVTQLPPEPTPTATPVWDVALLAQQSSVINVVQYTGPDNTGMGQYWFQGLKVIRPLKGSNKVGDLLAAWEGVGESRRLLENLQPGSDYILFQSGIYLTGEVGLFRIGSATGGQIVESPLPTYTGWTDAQFEAAIMAAINSATPTAIPTSSRQWDLTSLADSTDLIVQVHTNGSPGAPTERWRPDSTVTRWWKRPSLFWGNQIQLPTSDERGNPLPVKLQPGTDYIVFIGGFQRDNGIQFGGRYIVGGATGLFRIDGGSGGSGGQIAYAGLPEYQGWTVDRFNDELRRILAPVYTAHP